MSGQNPRLRRANAALFLISLGLTGVWVLSGVFGLPIIADALVLLAAHRPAPVLSGIVGVVLVAVAVLIVWLLVGLLARAPMFAEQPGFLRALFLVAAADLAFWAVFPLLTGFDAEVWVPYAFGALAGTVGYVATRGLANKRFHLTHASARVR